MSRIFKNLKPSLDFYFASAVSEDASDHSLYHIVAYTSKDDDDDNNNYMIYIAPQDLYFFIEDGKILYQPKQTPKKQQLPPSNIYEMAYCNDRVVKHRNLEYLKKHVYNQRVYYKTFNTLQDPNDVINAFIDTIYKRTGINKILKSFY